MFCLNQLRLGNWISWCDFQRSFSRAFISERPLKLSTTSVIAFKYKPISGSKHQREARSDFSFPKKVDLTYPSLPPKCHQNQNTDINEPPSSEKSSRYFAGWTHSRNQSNKVSNREIACKPLVTTCKQDISWEGNNCNWRKRQIPTWTRLQGVFG